MRYEISFYKILNQAVVTVQFWPQGGQTAKPVVNSRIVTLDDDADLDFLEALTLIGELMEDRI